jgi:hypothetical protein
MSRQQQIHYLALFMQSSIMIIKSYGASNDLAGMKHIYSDGELINY